MRYHSLHETFCEAEAYVEGDASKDIIDASIVGRSLSKSLLDQS